MEKVTNTAEIVVVVVEFINSQKLGGKKINSFNSSLLSLWYGMMNEKKIVVCYTHTHIARTFFLFRDHVGIAFCRIIVIIRNDY